MIRMASVEQALGAIAEQAATRRLGVETVPLAQAFGRVLAEPLLASPSRRPTSPPWMATPSASPT
jgi:molybdopterin biosynthesis enzyme